MAKCGIGDRGLRRRANGLARGDANPDLSVGDHGTASHDCARSDPRVMADHHVGEYDRIHAYDGSLTDTNLTEDDLFAITQMAQDHCAGTDGDVIPKFKKLRIKDQRFGPDED
jgi:hypothetical protein